MVDEKLASDFSFPASPGDYFPAIMGDPGEEAAGEVGASHALHAHTLMCTALRRTAAQSTTSGAFPDISFDTVDFNPHGWWDAGNPTQLHLPRGLYLAVSGAEFASNATGARYIAHALTGWGQNLWVPAVNGSGTRLNLATVLQAEEDNNILTLQVSQNSGGALNVDLAALFVFRLATFITNQ